MSRQRDLRMCCRCGDYGKWDEYTAYGRIDAYCPQCQPAHYDQIWEWEDVDDEA